MQPADDREISPQALMSLLQQPPAVVLVDVRKAHDFAADPVLIPGAEHHPPEQVEDWLGQLPADREVIVYCVHGHQVSNGVLDRLRVAGFRARLIDGGIEAWKQAGGAIVAVSAVEFRRGR